MQASHQRKSVMSFFGWEERFGKIDHLRMVENLSEEFDPGSD
jgi:hypothetical protein